MNTKLKTTIARWLWQSIIDCHRPHSECPEGGTFFCSLWLEIMYMHTFSNSTQQTWHNIGRFSSQKHWGYVHFLLWILNDFSKWMYIVYAQFNFCWYKFNISYNPKTLSKNFPFVILFQLIHVRSSFNISLSQSLLTLKVPENLQLYGLYVYYVVHIATLAC